MTLTVDSGRSGFEIIQNLLVDLGDLPLTPEHLSNHVVRLLKGKRVCTRGSSSTGVQRSKGDSEDQHFFP